MKETLGQAFQALDLGIITSDRSKNLQQPFQEKDRNTDFQTLRGRLIS